MLAVVAACAAKPAEPLRPVPPAPRVHAVAPIHVPPLVRAARADVTFPDLVPDLAEEPRWPLTGMQHPSLQPSYDIADALAEPGITWTELCARNVDRRRDAAHRDELLYLSGWCAAARHDPTAAVTLLAQVRGSAVPGIAHAVPFDIANILVDSQDAEHADAILVQAQIRGAHLYDMLAAAYFEIGRNDDALQATASALQLDSRHEAAATCHRLARSALLGPQASRALLVSELTSAANRKQPDPVCVELASEVSCVVDPEIGCYDYQRAHPMDAKLLELARLDEHWTAPRPWRDWLDVARDLHGDLARPQAAALFSAALDAAIVGCECDRLALRLISERVVNWTVTPGFEQVRPKVEWAAGLFRRPEECTSFRAHWLHDHPQ